MNKRPGGRTEQQQRGRHVRLARAQQAAGRALPLPRLGLLSHEPRHAGRRRLLLLQKQRREICRVACARGGDQQDRESNDALGAEGKGAQGKGLLATRPRRSPSRTQEGHDVSFRGPFKWWTPQTKGTCTGKNQGALPTRGRTLQQTHYVTHTRGRFPRNPPLFCSLPLPNTHTLSPRGPHEPQVLKPRPGRRKDSVHSRARPHAAASPRQAPRTPTRDAPRGTPHGVRLLAADHGRPSSTALPLLSLQPAKPRVRRGRPADAPHCAPAEPAAILVQQNTSLRPLQRGASAASPHASGGGAPAPAPRAHKRNAAWGNETKSRRPTPLEHTMCVTPCYRVPCPSRPVQRLSGEGMKAPSQHDAVCVLSAARGARGVQKAPPTTTAGNSAFQSRAKRPARRARAGNSKRERQTPPCSSLKPLLPRISRPSVQRRHRESHREVTGAKTSEAAPLSLLRRAHPLNGSLLPLIARGRDSPAPPSRRHARYTREDAAAPRGEFGGAVSEAREHGVAPPQRAAQAVPPGR